MEWERHERRRRWFADRHRMPVHSDKRHSHCIPCTWMHAITGSEWIAMWIVENEGDAGKLGLSHCRCHRSWATACDDVFNVLRLSPEPPRELQQLSRPSNFRAKKSCQIAENQCVVRVRPSPRWVACNREASFIVADQKVLGVRPRNFQSREIFLDSWGCMRNDHILGIVGRNLRWVWS